MGIGVFVEATIGADVRVGTGVSAKVAAGVGERVAGTSRALDLLALFIRTIAKGTEIAPITNTRIAISTQSTVGTLAGAAETGAG